MSEHIAVDMANAAYQISIRLSDSGLVFSLIDRQMDFELAHAPYKYQAARRVQPGELRLCEGLIEPSIRQEGDRLYITGTLAGLTLTHELWLPAGDSFFEERITLHNPEDQSVELEDFACGWQRRITNEVGRLLPALTADRLVAIPFRHGTTDPTGTDNDFSFQQIATGSGKELRINLVAPLTWGHGYVRSSKYFSEGWAWVHSDYSLGIFKFNQQAMEFSVLDTRADQDGTLLSFGGVGLRDGEPSFVTIIPASASITLGTTHFETTHGDFTEVLLRLPPLSRSTGLSFPSRVQSACPLE